jgi:hypothetical protein
MAQNGYGVEDVSNNPCYWEKDIDFIITSPFTGAVKSFEVKWDSRISSTNNLYLELSSAHSKGGKGWYKFCEADYLAYGDAVNKVFYIISFPELKERVKGLPQRYANCGDDSTGLLVSIGAIKDLV